MLQFERYIGIRPNFLKAVEIKLIDNVLFCNGKIISQQNKPYAHLLERER